jgi:endonuclease/exonuclease/phosphatase family metal-dependent hydrolase
LTHYVPPPCPPTRIEFEKTYCQKSNNSEVEYYNLQPIAAAQDYETSNEITILTLNCNYNLDGTNADQIAPLIYETGATCVCLQEVTRKLVEQLQDAVQDFSIYTTIFEDESTYGLAMLTKHPISNYSSFPLPSEQGRRIDIAIFDNFLVTNIHAESLMKGEQLRYEQFKFSGEKIQEIMDTKNIDVCFFVGDMNTRDETIEGFEDANEGGPVNTYQIPGKNIRYYDRILKIAKVPVQVHDWSVLEERDISDHHPVLAKLEV